MRREGDWWSEEEWETGEYVRRKGIGCWIMHTGSYILFLRMSLCTRMVPWYCPSQSGPKIMDINCCLSMVSIHCGVLGWVHENETVHLGWIMYIPTYVCT